MAQATLVNLDISQGRDVVNALDSAGLTPKVALWISTPEYEDGRVVLASPNLDQSNPLRAYQAVISVLHETPGLLQSSVLILKMRDPMIVALRRTFGSTKSVEGMRLGGQTFGNRYISEAYVYRIQ